MCEIPVQISNVKKILLTQGGHSEIDQPYLKMNGKRSVLKEMEEKKNRQQQFLAECAFCKKALCEDNCYSHQILTQGFDYIL